MIIKYDGETSTGLLTRLLCEKDKNKYTVSTVRRNCAVGYAFETAAWKSGFFGSFRRPLARWITTDPCLVKEMHKMAVTMVQHVAHDIIKDKVFGYDADGAVSEIESAR
jgi:hypothetical protein